MPKRATKVILSEKEREEVEQLTKRHRSEQQQEGGYPRKMGRLGKKDLLS